MNAEQCKGFWDRLPRQRALLNHFWQVYVQRLHRELDTGEYSNTVRKELDELSDVGLQLTSLYAEGNLKKVLPEELSIGALPWLRI